MSLKKNKILIGVTTFAVVILSRPVRATLVVVNGPVCELNFNAIMPVAVQGSTFDFPMKDGPAEADRDQPFVIAAYPGGILIQQAAGEKSGPLIDVWREGKEWCLRNVTVIGARQKCVETLRAPLEIKNAAGDTIGVAQAFEGHLHFTSAQTTFLKSGYRLDPAAPILDLTYAEGRTTVMAKTPTGPLAGILTMVGNSKFPPPKDGAIQNKYVFGAKPDEGCLRAPPSQLEKFRSPSIGEPAASRSLPRSGTPVR